jgi:CRISPR-associated protein Cmr6
MGQVGRVWHRMYPQVILRRNDDGTPNPIVTRNYLEFLTIFPDESQESTNFLRFLARANRFQKVWPIN